MTSSPNDTISPSSLILTEQEMIFLLREKGYTIAGEQSTSSAPAASASPTTVSIDNSKSASGSVDPALLLMMMQYQQQQQQHQHQLTMAQLSQQPPTNPTPSSSSPPPIINVNASSNNNNNNNHNHYINGGHPYNPPVVLQPVPILTQLPDFSTGLFSCCSDCSVCLCGTFFPCCQFGLNHYRLKNYSIPQCIENGISYCLVFPFLTCFVHSRSHTRRMLHLRPDPNDACVVIFCPVCALCQEGREIKKRQAIIDQQYFQQSLVLSHVHPQQQQHHVQIQQPMYIVNPPVHYMR